MGDSDDYFDDLVLDDRTLAALDEVEVRYATTKTRNPVLVQELARPIARADRPPPSKRQKTGHVPFKHALSEDDDEDLPEISLHGGVYQVASTKPVSANSAAHGTKSPHSSATRIVPTNAANVVPASRTMSAGGLNRQPQISRQASGPVFNAQSTAPNSQAPRGIQRQQSNQRVFGSQSAPKSARKSSDSVSKLEIEILRSQLDELKNARGDLEQRLRDAEDARLAKEGEVSILRASINKTSDEHAAEVARLQTARELADAARLQLIKDQKDELERLRTHYTFRQHELETSTRKPPWSVSKKQTRPVPNTPVKMPSQMRDWSTGNLGAGLNLLAETPRRPRFGEVGELASQRPRRVGMSSEDAGQQQSALPGFQNAFTLTPSRALSQRTMDKRKGKQRASLANDNLFFAGGARSSPPSSPTVPHIEDLAEEPLSLRPVGASMSPPKIRIPFEDDHDDDVRMEEAGGDDSDLDELSEIAPPNWRDELIHIIFTHASPSNRLPTMQLLLDTSLSHEATEQQREEYRSSCTHLLQSLGAISRPNLWEDNLRDIAHGMVKMTRVLVDTATLSPLAALFNLFRLSAYTIPNLTTALLSLPSDENIPQLLSVVCDTICNHTSNPEAATVRAEVDNLSREVLWLLEALALTVPEESAMQLSYVLRAQVMSILLAAAQPTWLIAHAIRALCVLASHPNFFRPLLTSTVPYGVQDGSAMADFAKHIEQLSLYLIDPTRDGPEGDELHEHILTFVATLALSDPDALATLLRSQTLIPSIIIYLTNVTNSFWEDDETLISSQVQTDRVLRTISRTVALLYYMIFTPTEPVRLNHKLHQAPHLLSDGVSHMFVVTMGRFSFADSPSWLNNAARLQLEQTVDMARQLLELAMQGPELDMVWTAFQADSEDTAADDDNDEEREARLRHPAD